MHKKDAQFYAARPFYAGFGIHWT